MSDDILETMREYKEHSETKSEQKAFDAVIEEITRLRADLAAVTAERDRMREVIKGINAMLEISCETLERPTHCPLEVGQRHSPLSQKEIIQRLTETCSFVRADLSRVMDEARAAIAAIRPHIEAAEREQCARIAETPELWLTDKPNRGCDDIAAAIRSGSGK